MKYLLPLLILFAFASCSGEKNLEEKGLKHVFRNADGSSENGLPDDDHFAEVIIKKKFLNIRRYHYEEDQSGRIVSGDILESKKNRDHYYYLVQNAHGDSKIAVCLFTGSRSDMYLDSIRVERREERGSPYFEDYIVTGDIRWKGKYRKL